MSLINLSYYLNVLARETIKQDIMKTPKIASKILTKYNQPSKLSVLVCVAKIAILIMLEF